MLLVKVIKKHRPGGRSPSARGTTGLPTDPTGLGLSGGKQLSFIFFAAEGPSFFCDLNWEEI
jgi:hypothetical protein